MTKDYNQKILSSVENSLPPGRKPVPYLMDLLSLSKESAYRRVRGEIPFSFEEVVRLSSDLDLSIDAIVGRKDKNRAFFDLQAGPEVSPQDSFLEMLRQNTEIFRQMSESKESELMISLNRISVLFYTLPENLFKFFYYRYLQKMGKFSTNFSFSELKVPSEIISLFEKHKRYSRNIKNVTYVFDHDIFIRVIKVVLYYYRRNLLTEEEFLSIRDDLFFIFDRIEKLSVKGVNEFGTNYSLYLSSLDINSNCLYGKYDDREFAQFFPYLDNPMIVYNEEVCAVQKKWIDSLKKYSTLITQSSEMLQSLFLNKQREYINSMSDTHNFNNFI